MTSYNFQLVYKHISYGTLPSVTKLTQQDAKTSTVINGGGGGNERRHNIHMQQLEI